jgi:hypothetical protein
MYSAVEFMLRGHKALDSTARTIKISEENLGQNCHDLELA